MTDEPTRRHAGMSPEAVEQAIQQARREERVNARLDQHDGDLHELRAGQAETTASLHKLGEQVGRIEQAIAESAAAARAIAEHAATAVTGRQLYIALGMFLLALLGLFLGVGGHGA